VAGFFNTSWIFLERLLLIVKKFLLYDINRASIIFKSKFLYW